MRIHRAIMMAAACFVTVSAAIGNAIPDRNVNMVSGTGWPGGDPFLQRQNEPSIAVSTRNPLHLLAGANDYRTVDIPGLENIKVIGDAWLGVFRSYDGGNTWTSTLLPGYPQDTSAAGMASPLKGYPAGADPVVRAGANGIFYYAGITLSRDENPLGALFVARYLDYNDKESSHLAAESAHSIRYVDTNILQYGTAGQFNDKEWLAVDVPRAGSAPCTIDGQTVEGGNVYVSWTILVGGDENIRSKMMVTRSTDCGATWDQPIKLSETHAINQGSSIAIDPVTGYVYVVWRRIRNDRGETDALLFAKSTDFGKTFSKPQLIREITPFEQGTTTLSFRTTMFPSMAVDGNGQLYVAYSERNAEGRGRIALITSANGTTWSAPVFIANHGLGHQFMPTLSFSAGKLTAAWYDQTEDHTRGIYEPILTPDNKLSGQYSETRQPQGHRALGQLQHVFKDFIQEFGDGAPLLRRHTLDVFVAQADPGAMPLFQAQRASQYYFGSRPQPNELTGEFEIEQMQFNPPNLPLFRQGTTPFIGDYLDLGLADLMSKEEGIWRFKTEPSKAPVRHLVWTDNRDVRPPADGNWRNYTPVGSLGGSSLFEGTLAKPACISGQAGMRNQNIYTTRVTNGLFAGSPGNAKPFFDEFGNPLQRAFVVFVQNALKETKTYRLEIVNDPLRSAASFLQFETLKVLYVSIPPRSTIARTVFAVAGSKYEEIEVKVEEVAAPGGEPLPDGLATTVVLNPDIANPDIANPDIANPDIANPDIANAEVYNPDIANPDIANPDIANPDIANPDIANPDIANPDIANPDIANPDIANPDIANPDIANPDIANPDIANGAVTDTTWETTNEGNTAASYSINLLLNGQVPEALKLQLILHRIYETPIAKPDCTLGLERHTVLAANINNPEFTAPGDLLANDVIDSSEKNATIYILPGETIRITLRVVNPDPGNIFFNAAEQVTPIAVAHGVNTLDARGGIFERSASLTVVTTRTPDVITDETYTTDLVAVGGKGQKKWKSENLPGNLHLDQNGKLTGTLSISGDYTFVALVEDSNTGKPHSDSERIHIRAVDRLIIPPHTLDDALVDDPYSATLTFTGGVAPFAWSLASGSSLPEGLSLSPAGVISGTATTVGTSSFTVRLTDGTYPVAQTATRDITIQVVANTIHLVFVTQPESAIEGTSPSDISVRAQDASGAVLPGVAVTLELGQNPCAVSSVSRQAETNEAGLATFTALPMLDACYGYAYRASGTSVGFAPGSADSNVFDIYGFATATRMSVERAGHTATVLQDGRVLVIGGRDTAGTFIAATEIYDPSTGTWMPGPALNYPRWEHSATLLPTGEVLVTGGLGLDQHIAAVEKYVPGSNSFVDPGAAYALRTPRRNHTATLLPDGSVVIVAGRNFAGGLASIEVVHEDGTVALPAGLSFARANHTATLIGDAIYVIGGGMTATGVADVERILSDGTVEPAGTLAVGRVLHAAIALDSGSILVAGGYGPVDGYPEPVPVSSTELYDPDTERASPGPQMNAPHTAGVASKLPDGTIIIAGGSEPEPLPGTRFRPTDAAELFNPATGVFTPFGRLSSPRTGIESVLASGQLLAIGGVEEGDGSFFVSTVERFLPAPVALQIVPAVLDDARTGVPYRAKLQAVGGAGTQTWSVVDGSLPAEITLAADGTLSGVPTVAGIHGFAARVTDSGTPQGSETAEYTLRVVDPLLIPAQTLRNATLGVPYSETLIVNGGAAPYAWSLLSGSLPDGLSLSKTGAITGTCRTTGGHSLTVEVADDTRPQPQTAQATLALQCDSGVLEFVNQPTSAVSGELVSTDLVVRARDTSGFALAGIEVTLSEPFQPCQPGNLFGLHLPRTVATDAAGEAHFGSLRALRGCYDVTVRASSTGFSTPVSNLFDVAGFGDERSVTDRLGHTATELSDGRILIVGGVNSGGGMPLSAILYDPVLQSSRFVGDLNHARMYHTATLLNSGKVLIAGGHQGTRTSISVLIGEAELYDPATEQFTLIQSSMVHARTFHTATLHTSGKVFLVGGRNEDGLVSEIEVYDPAPPLQDLPPPPFTAGPRLATPRTRHTATLAGDRIVVIGGIAFPGPRGTAEVEVIESETSITTGGTLVKGRANHSATLLNDGRIFIAGGFNADNELDDSAELYSLDDLLSTAVPTLLPTWFANHSAARLTSGDVVLAGSSDDGAFPGRCTSALCAHAEVVLYDPDTNGFESYGTLRQAKGNMATVPLTRSQSLAGRVIVIGGEQFDGFILNQVDTFFPKR